MSVAHFIGFIALLTAAVIVAAVVRRHWSETGVETSWSYVKEAFTGGALREAREDAARLSGSDPHATDVRVGELFAEAEEGSGYLEPRDILTPREDRG